MVALLHPEHVPATGRESIERPRLRLMDDRPVDDRGPAGRGHEQSAGETSTPRTRPLTGLVVLLGLVVLMLIVVLRVAQGTPPAASWEGLALSAYEAGNATAATEALATGDRVHLVQAGDTLWAIAVELDPGADPRPVVDALADRNGGPVLQIGQRLVIPAELLAD